MKSIGKALAKARRTADLRQKDVAQVLGVTDRAVSCWERGVNQISAERMSTFAQACGTSPQAIYDLAHSMERRG